MQVAQQVSIAERHRGRLLWHSTAYIISMHLCMGDSVPAGGTGPMVRQTGAGIHSVPEKTVAGNTFVGGGCCGESKRLYTLRKNSSLECFVTRARIYPCRTPPKK